MEAALLLVLLVALLLVAAAGRHRSLARFREQAAPALFQVIEALIRNRPFTRSAVSRIVGTALPGHDPDKYFETFLSDRDAKATIQSVEVRRPTSASSKQDGLVILTVNPKARITPAAVVKRFGAPPEFQVPHPEVPHGSAYRYRQPWGDLSFCFARRTEYLMTVALDAIDPQPAATPASHTG